MLKKIVFALCAVALLITPVLATDAAKPAPKAEAKATAYPLDTCIVSGEKLDAKAVSMVHDGQEFKFCCKDCIKKFNADPKKYTALLAEKSKAKKG